jgi:hypothetical protein
VRQREKQRVGGRHRYGRWRFFVLLTTFPSPAANHCLDLKFSRPIKSVIARRAVEIGNNENMDIEQVRNRPSP